MPVIARDSVGIVRSEQSLVEPSRAEPGGKETFRGPFGSFLTLLFYYFFSLAIPSFSTSSSSSFIIKFQFACVMR